MSYIEELPPVQDQQLESLSHFERKEYEELKEYYTHETKRLRDQSIILGVLVVSFIATLMMSGVLKIDAAAITAAF